MRDPFFFGYGSLVNTRTHGYGRTSPAVLPGWRRIWAQTSLRPAAFLSVQPAPGTEIAGLIAAVPGGDWQALDRREAAYRREPAAGLRHDAPGVTQVEVYRVDAALLDPVARHPILLSYLDVVVQGFLQVHGPEGAEAFFATTVGWHAPVEDDRGAPRYPRAQPLSPAERALVDRLLGTVA